MNEQILIIGPAWVGDMVMAQGLFRLLKRQNPAAEIDVLAPRFTFALLNRMPEVRDALEMPVTHGELKLNTRFKLAKQLSQTGYAQAIVLPNSFKSALLPLFARIPKRTGWTGEFRYPLLNDRRVLNEKQLPRMIDRYHALGLPKNANLPADLPVPHFVVNTSAQSAALEKYGLVANNQRIIALAPGAAFGPAKRWPAHYFAEVARAQLAEGAQVWLFGSKDEKALADEIMSLTDNRCVDLIGAVPLDDTIDLFASISGLVSNDSGLMHLAAALQKPLLALYGPTSPHFTPPLSEAATILQLSLPCQPCFQRSCPLQHHHCMRQLTPGKAIATMALWEQ